MQNLNVGEYIGWHNHTGGPFYRLYYSGQPADSVFALTFCEGDKSIPLYFPSDTKEISIKDDEKGKQFKVAELSLQNIQLEEILNEQK